MLCRGLGKLLGVFIPFDGLESMENWTDGPQNLGAMISKTFLNLQLEIHGPQCAFLGASRG